MRLRQSNARFGASPILAALAVLSVFPLSDAGAQEAGGSLFSRSIPILVPDAADVTRTTTTEWMPPTEAGKASQICVSFPTMQDPYWIAANYGVVTEAQRLGVGVDILNAGSYNNLSTQINQLNDCAAKGAEAVLVAPISVEGVAPTIASLKASGIPVINIIPRITSGENLAGRATLDYFQVGLACAQYLKDSVGDAAARVALFPGPPGADWSVRTLDGFKAGIAGTKIELVTVKYGDTDKGTQYNLVADTLNAEPELDWIVGNAVAADAAIGAVKAANARDRVKIGSTYQTGPVRTALKDGTVQWALSDNVVWMASIGIDMAVKAVNGDLPEGAEVWPVPQKLTKENADSEAAAPGFAPDGFKPVFSVAPGKKS